MIDVCYLERLSHASRHTDPRVGPGWPRDLWASCGHGLLMKPCVFHEVVGVCVRLCEHTFDQLNLGPVANFYLSPTLLMLKIKI